MTRHISNLNIETFRGIKGLELKDLGDVNILVGANNCGKTSVLEATMLLGAPDSFPNILSCSRLREANRLNTRFTNSFFDSFLLLFNRLSDELEIGVSGKNDIGDIKKSFNLFIPLRGSETSQTNKVSIPDHQVHSAASGNGEGDIVSNLDYLIVWWCDNRWRR